jgi:tetratricopeptide (TPR) repeat protein
MPNRYFANFRHAQYYIQRMIFLNAEYEKGGDEAFNTIQMVRIEWENIRKGREWVCTVQPANKAIRQLIVDYASHGTFVKDLILTVSEQIDWLSVGLKAAITLENKEDEAIVLGNLGAAYHSGGDLSQAEKYYKEYLKISQNIGYFSGEVNALCNLGILNKDLGRFETAIQYYEKSLGMYHKDSVSPRIYCSILGNLGSVYMKMGEFQKAREYLLEANRVAEQSGDKKATAQTITNLASVNLELENYKDAIQGYSRAIAIHQGLGNLAGEEVATTNLGVAYARQNDFNHATIYYQKALEIQKKLGNRRSMGPTLNNLGAAYAALGDLQKALPLYSERLQIALEFNDPSGALAACENLGLVYADLGELNLSIQFYEQALEFAEKMNLQTSILLIRKKMDNPQNTISK